MQIKNTAEDMNRQFANGKILIANKYVHRFFTSLIVKEKLRKTKLTILAKIKQVHLKKKRKLKDIVRKGKRCNFLNGHWKCELAKTFKSIAG